MSLFRGLVLLMCGIGGFFGGVAVLYRYVAKPIGKFIDELREWRTVPQDLHDLKEMFTEHIAQTEERLTALEPPRIRRRVSL
ncbi:MAG TPA: hypothetical protein VGL75_04440 [Acidothermaceae bacterium]